MDATYFLKINVQKLLDELFAGAKIQLATAEVDIGSRSVTVGFQGPEISAFQFPIDRKSQAFEIHIQRIVVG